MHAFFLGSLSRHCQDIWGMDVNVDDGEGQTTDPLTSEIRSSADFQRAFSVLRTGTLEALQSFKARTLYYLAVDQGIQVKGRKHKDLINVLAKYVIPVLLYYSYNS
jgi:hypothetical protein